jgi:hypothetical protein
MSLKIGTSVVSHLSMTFRADHTFRCIAFVSGNLRTRYRIKKLRNAGRKRCGLPKRVPHVASRPSCSELLTTRLFPPRLMAERPGPGSQARFSVFNGRSALPAAMPISASFFFESETARLMFVRHRWPEGFRWWLFCQFPREDTAADYERGHDRPESPKLHLLHCGVLRSLTTTSHCCIRKLLNQALRNSSGNLAKFTAIRAWRRRGPNHAPWHQRVRF